MATELKKKKSKEVDSATAPIMLTGYKIFEYATQDGPFQKLMKRDDLPPTVSLRIARISKFLKDELQALNDERDKLVKKFSKKDEDGEPITKGGNTTIDDIIGFNKAAKELEGEEYECKLPRPKIKMTRFKKLKLSPGEWEVLDLIGNIIEEDDDE